VARVLFPWLTARIRASFGQLLQPPPVTQLQLERYLPEPGESNGHIGFSQVEMADIVQRLLQAIVVMIIVAFVSFALFNFVGDPVMLCNLIFSVVFL